MAPKGKISANVGIIGHAIFEEMSLSLALKKTFSQVFLLREWSGKVAIPNNPTPTEIRTFIQSMKLNIVVLEANLGVPGGNLAFDANFFHEYSNVSFCLYSGKDLSVQVKDLPANVLGYLTKPTTVDQIKKLAADYVERLPSGLLINIFDDVKIRPASSEDPKWGLDSNEDEEDVFEGESGGR
ncbi:MAG TPA: hypothetical protein VIQ31_10845 [Phormidium sp.]